MALARPATPARRKALAWPTNGLALAVASAASSAPEGGNQKPVLA